MKFLLDENKKFYKGNMHCHSTKSDGKLTPEELKEKYKSNGYSFLAITDHEVLYNNSYLDDEDFITITSTEYAFKEFAEQSTLKNFNMKVAHFNLYAKKQDNVNNFLYNTVYDHFSDAETKAKQLEKFGENKRKYTPKCINKFIKDANKKGFFVAYNHPRWSLENYKQYSKYEGLWGVEVFNSISDKDGIYEYNINVYDDFLRDGKKVFASCGDDNHNIKNRDSNECFGAFVMVNADSLSYDNIINGLLNGNFYSSQGPIIKSLVLDGDTVKVKCSDCYQISFSTYGRRSGSVHDDNCKLTEAEFKIRKEDIYFRIDVIDKYGKRANTQAYYV